jgi:hypothetical protein
VGDLAGEEAVYELAIWNEGEFLFTPGRDSDQTTIQKSNTNLLMEAARRIDEWQVLSKRIPSTRMVPIFTDQAATTSVSFTPAEWRLICKVDERRTIEEVAAGLATSPFEVCKLLYGLITSGLVQLTESLGQEEMDRLQQMTPEQLEETATAVHEAATALLKDRQMSTQLDAAHRMSRTEMDSGRGVEAVVDLIRAQEKLVSGALGPNQSKVYLEQVGTLLRR